MSGILVQPNEMLLSIIEQTSASDISSLASSDRRLQNLSQERFRFLKEKRAEVKEIYLGGKASNALATHPLKYLQDIFEDDHIRFFTKVINIEKLDPADSNKRRPDSEVVRDFILSMRSQYESQISALIAEVYDALLPHAIKTDLREWTENVISGEPKAVVILLLALYPYLEILNIERACLDWFGDTKTTQESESMPHEHQNEASWVNLFRSLTATAREPGTNKLKIFSKLSKFYLEGEDYQEYFHDNLGPVTPLMALPAMRTICCHNLAGNNVPWPYGVATSNVTSLTLSGFVDKASMRNIISGFKRLEEFNYQIANPEFDVYEDYRDRMKWGPHIQIDNIANIDPDSYQDENNIFVEDRGELAGASLPRWEPRAITECLLQWACDSLVSLQLTAFSFTEVSDLSGNEPFLPSLRPFRVLKKVHLDTMMLFEGVERPEIISVIGGDFVQLIKAQKLVDFLPSSIENVYITCEYVGKGLSKRDVEAMFTGLPAQRTRLPRLSRFDCGWMGKWNSPIPRNLEAEREGWQELVARCRANEIDLRTNEGYGEPSLRASSNDSSEE